MSDEATLRTFLDLEPGDLAARQLLADWLAERGDARAAGFRWMARFSKWPFWLPSSRKWSWTDPSNSFPYHNHLPTVLYAALRAPVESSWKKYATMLEAEEDLCLCLPTIEESLAAHGFADAK